MDNDRFARTIKNARLKKGYTQSQLADLLNVSNKTISKWETGRGYPDITLLAKITSILKLDYEELLQSNEYIIQKRKKKRIRHSFITWQSFRMNVPNDLRSVRMRHFGSFRNCMKRNW